MYFVHEKLFISPILLHFSDSENETACFFESEFLSYIGNTWALRFSNSFH